SEKTAQQIDEETKKILNDAFVKATELIKNNIEKLNRLAEKLVEKEILEGDELAKLLNGETETTDGRR
ncbi:MAG: cell division protein FtsH, partial [Elusimicrobia bacterium CG06_land_8_20_14_3_00_38_11]